MNGGSGAEPILEVKNLKTHMVYPSPWPLPEASGRGERTATYGDRRTNRFVTN